MKIVHLCLNGPVTDGWNYQDNVLTKFHKKLGYDVTIIASQWVHNSNNQTVKFDKEEYINSDGVKMIRLKNRGKGTVDSHFKLYEGVYKAIEKEQPDILFVHGFHYFDAIQIAKYAKKHPVKVYVDNHSDYSNSATNWVSKNILHKILWKFCAHIIEPYTKKFYGVLPARVDFLKELYHLPEDKCELLVMGADDELVQAASNPEVKTAIRQKYDLDEEDFVVMTGGKIDRFKTQTLMLMDAVNQIDNPKLKLIVFGSVTEELKSEVEKRCSNRVKYIGWVKSEDSYQYFAAADLVVFPGRHSVFWEQVTGQGIPMLVKDWDGTHHVDLGGNVRFLTKDCVEEIRLEIERLVEHPEEYQKMKKVAMEKGMTVFSYRDIAKRSIQVD